MSLFHTHSWKLEGVHYTPPSAVKFDRGEGAALLENIIRRAQEGVTNIYLRCSECGDVKSTMVYGRYQPQDRQRQTASQASATPEAT